MSTLTYPAPTHHDAPQTLDPDAALAWFQTRTSGLLAVEALGSCTVVASDKTGTLTRNRLTAQRIALPAEGMREVTGGPLRPEGATLGECPVPTEDGVLSRLYTAVTLRNEAFLGRDKAGGWIQHGDAVDVALLVIMESHKFWWNRRYPAPPGRP